MEKANESAFDVQLRTIESKQWFGYCTMLNMSHRQSTVTATEHTICLVWSNQSLNEFFGRCPGTSALLRDGLAGQRVMRELSNASFMTNLADEHAALLTTLFQSRFIPANTVIFEEGENAADSSSLFVLVSGSAVMYQAVPGGGSNLVKAIEPGDFFGEACMLFKLPRIGTGQNPATHKNMGLWRASSGCVFLFLLLTTACVAAGCMYGCMGSVRTNHASLVMELSFSSFASFLKYTPHLGVDVKRAFNNNSILSIYLMQNPVILAAFREFCLTEQSSENVDVRHTHTDSCAQQQLPLQRDVSLCCRKGHQLTKYIYLFLLLVYVWLPIVPPSCERVSHLRAKKEGAGHLGRACDLLEIHRRGQRTTGQHTHTRTRSVRTDL